MEQYPTNENAWLFWLCCALAALAALVIFAYFADKFKKKKPIIKPIEIEEPKNYKIDAVSMTYNEAFQYYYKELDRKRRKNTLHLTIKNPQNWEIIYDKPASEFFEKTI